MKNRKTSVIFSILMIVALVGGLLLMKQNQEIRKGAYFAGTKLFILPEDISGLTGERVPVQLWAETENEAKISSIDVSLCYGQNDVLGLALPDDDIKSTITLNDVVLEKVLSATKETINGKSCLRLVAISDLTAKPEDLKGGTVKLATIDFLAGEPGNGEISIESEKCKIGGYNPVGTGDNALRVGEVKGATYEITGEGTISENDSVLNYKIAFANVNANNAGCVVDWPLQIIVLGGGKSAVYTNVIPQTKEAIDGKLVFSGTKILAGFQQRSGVAVFIKGPKHLQVKYGISGQQGSYNKAGGEIVLTNKAATSPINDFSKYPIIAGDVKGTNSEAQDGWINGVDYAYVKSIPDHESITTGGYKSWDLDGNCQKNPNDLVILKYSLQSKQGELY